MPDIRPAIGLPPTDTVEFFRQKGYAVQVEWDELYQEDHGRAFTVTKLLNADLLRKVRMSLDDVIANGGTYEMWKARITPELQAGGWLGRVDDTALTGVDRPIWVGDRRLRTIYDTNLRMARAAGQWKRIQQLKKGAPFLMYSAVDDSRTRPLHRRWDGTILPVDHPWWNTHFPPCGWNCRCTTIQLSQRDLDRMGLAVSEPPDSGPDRRYRRSNGQIVSVPAGIDPGFAYNPGQAYLRSVADQARDGLEALAKTDLPAARRILKDVVDSPSFDQFMGAPDTPFPVMLLDDAVRDSIGATSRVVLLSSDTFAKQLRHHPELDIAQYRQLPDVGATPDLIFQVDDQRIILMRRDDGRWLKAVTKATASGAATYVTSFHLTGEQELRRLRRLHPLIFGQIAGTLAVLLGFDTEEEEEMA